MLRERKRYPNENHHDHDMRHYFEDEEEGGGTERVYGDDDEVAGNDDISPSRETRGEIVYELIHGKRMRMDGWIKVQQVKSWNDLPGTR
ncbi:hypothetical protein ZHAS_00018280 [Anopheles sinensis]|uniref:Uncharacterized protein n=1 Tax=Anopheles sinensis TaxID=74873 RepID=A0A084WJ18_ANOSI|nr:hypothetical protein ZHAS_00018280 [Anopheles sinensis]